MRSLYPTTFLHLTICGLAWCRVFPHFLRENNPMGQINLYKIRGDRQADFLLEIEEKLPHSSSAVSKQIQNGDTTVTIDFTLYLPTNISRNPIAWDWVFGVFGESPLDVIANPKAIIIAQENCNMYAITFGAAFFLADKFCDRDFGFSFARKLDFQKIKTTTLLSPYSKKNKTVNSYIDFVFLEFDSGESFAKIKADIRLQNNFSLFQKTIHIGNSIQFTVQKDSLETIGNLIVYIEHTLLNVNDKHKIPVFSEVVKDKELIKRLNISLSQAVVRSGINLCLSEFDIIGVTEVFSGHYTYQLKYGRHMEEFETLTIDNLHDFFSRLQLANSYEILDIKVERIKDGSPVQTDRIRELIDYTNDNEQCLLSKGKWYRFNDDYLDYLRESIAEIDVEHYPEFDFTKQHYNDFLQEKFNEERNNQEYDGLGDDRIRAKIKSKYYREYSFNTMRTNEGFELQDRCFQRIGGMSVEVADLYQNGTMFAVKMGKSSSSLSFVVEQSLNTVNLFKHKMLGNLELRTVGIWLVLDRGPLPLCSKGKPDINDLNMLMLKNRLGEWKKEVRLAGLHPLIYVNYIR